MAVTLAAGDVVTAARFNALAPMYVAQSSDQSLTTSAADWNIGAISLDASTTWYVEMFWKVGNASTGGFNFRPSYVVTGGTTQGNVFVIGPAAGETSAVGAANAAIAVRTNSVTNSYGVPTATTDSWTLVRAVTVLTSTTAGTFKAQAAMSSGTGTLYAGSFLIAHRVS